MALLVADSIVKSFGNRRILTSATLRAVAGEVRVIFGRNGIGKSTLMKIAVGRAKPDSGVVFYDGSARLRITQAELAREGVFYLADEELFSSAFSIRRQLQFLHEAFGGVAVVEAAERAGIAHLLDQRPSALSPGELRRAELAAVMVRRPRCLIADEPYRGIAPKDAEELSEVFRELAADGCAVVLSGHEVQTLLDVADHITWCESGTTQELGPPSHARLNEQLQREYLGPP